MRLGLLLFLFYFHLTPAIGQLSFDEGPFDVNITPDVIDEKIDLNIYNNSSRDLEFWWEIDRGSCPDEWEFYLCDLNLCYTTAIQSCPCNKQNLIAPSSDGVLMLHILANGVQGSGVINLRILSECEGETSAHDLPITFVVDNSTSTEFSELNNNINLYPNPAFDLISLKNDINVSEIVFYNIIGKKIKTISHQKGQKHEVSDLDKGIYLVRLLNKDGDMLKVLRLTKK